MELIKDTKKRLEALRGCNQPMYIVGVEKREKKVKNESKNKVVIDMKNLSYKKEQADSLLKVFPEYTYWEAKSQYEETKRVAYAGREQDRY